MDDKGTSELVKYLKALLVVQAHYLAKSEDTLKPEILLTRAGMSAREIAEVLGKNQAAVAKTIERSKKAAKMLDSQAAVHTEDQGESPARVA